MMSIILLGFRLQTLHSPPYMATSPLFSLQNLMKTQTALLSSVTLSTIVHPFPTLGQNGQPCFLMKTYSENMGVVCLKEHQLVHACAAHYEVTGCHLEVSGTKHLCCGKCKQVYY